MTLFFPSRRGPSAAAGTASGAAAGTDADLVPDRLAVRRSRALFDARAELTEADPSLGPVIATGLFGPGCLAVAVAGAFDRAAVECLAVLLRDLRRAAVVELVLDLDGLDPDMGHDARSRLARVLGQTRIQCLIDGVRLELHQLPPSLRDAVTAAQPGTG